MILLLKAKKGSKKAGAKYYKRLPKPGGGYRYFYSESAYKKHKTKKNDDKEVRIKSKKKPTGLTKGREKKSLTSKTYYQVPHDIDGKTMWKKYQTYDQYRKDYPNGPEMGHILVNQNHPAHLRIDQKADWYIKYDGKTYASRAEFVKLNPMPSKGQIKKITNNGESVSVKVEANFRHGDWHPSVKEKLNADTRKYLGVQNAYEKDRAIMVMMYDKESSQRQGRKWSVEDYKKRQDKETLKFQKPGAVKPKGYGSIMRKGTKAKFEYRGKVVYGKVLETKSVGKAGKEVKKGATHYLMEFNLADKNNLPPTSLKKVKSKVQQKWVKKENAERAVPARINSSKIKQDEATQQREEEKIAKKLEGAKDRLIGKGDINFQTKVLDILGGEQGLKDPKSPINRIIAKRVYQIVNNMYDRGIDPYQSMTRQQIHEAGLVGVFDAVLDWKPEKAKLETFLQSDHAKDYIKNSINDALSVERQQFHKMSPEGKATIFKLKQVKDTLIESNDGKSPSKTEIVSEYKAIYGKAKFDLMKMADMLNNKRVKNIIESTNADGELDMMSNLHSHYKTPEEAYLEKEKMEIFHNSLTKVLPIAKERQALLLRFRVDETTTGKGVYGEESQYQTKEMADVSQHDGNNTTGKDPHTRNYSEIAKMLGLKTSVDAQSMVQRSIENVRLAHEKGDTSAKELVNMIMNKSYEEKRDFVRLYLFKSIFPEKRDAWIEKQIINAQYMMKSILTAA